jgi:uncharacterized membrane protein required for colicin V production
MLLSISSNVGIAIDVAIIALVVICALIGFHKGFFKSVISMISTFVVLIISILGASPIAKMINKIYNFTELIAGKLCKTIASMGTFYSEPIPEGVSGSDIINNIPSSTNGFLKKLMSYVLKPLTAKDIQGETVADIVSGAFASIIMLIISGLVLFILIKIILAIATRLFDNITRNRVLGGANKICGFVFGAAKGALIVVVFTIVLTLLTVLPFINTKISPIIQDNTKVARPIYNYTDEMMEKYIVDGKIVQKWIDNLWENKYKGKGNVEIPAPDTTPNGTIDRPYLIELTESEGVYIGSVDIMFDDINTIRYYKFTPSVITVETFTISIVIEGDNYEIYSTDDTTNKITDLTTLDKTKDYVVKFVRGETETEAFATITLTPNS